MAQFETKLYGNFPEIADSLHEEIMASAMTIRLTGQTEYSSGEFHVSTFVYDKYYMRNSSRASLTLTIIGNGREITVSAIGSGGGNSALFSFSWGAEENFVSVVERAVRRWAEQ
ncbi:DUF6054 family protein [Papillibacter cinnamivorans]|uniref:Uncharacterized protein n=1 Tax=Papillibacter cinnamivorans DSM 12816 TaxID=1122930 RepID=A0A1W2CUF7_9FIRM|nr:DUF6054 family protein [Papillibacter cinnamivorans]SMC88875.1 hypothetical protein SAMN02745168_0239 [Papillibacter cinnamivorans DSM 12816]